LIFRGSGDKFPSGRPFLSPGVIPVPFKEEMSWDASKKRWHRMHRGVMYRVAASKLGEDKSLPGVEDYTRDGSRAAANEWWRRKEFELEGRPARVEALRRMLSPEDELRRQVRELAEKLRARDQALEDLGDAAILKGAVIDCPPGDSLEFSVDLREANRELARRPEIDQLALVGKPAPAPTERTVRANAERFLAVVMGSTKALTYREIRQYLDTLVADLGKDTDVAVLDEGKVEGVFLRLKAADLSQGTKKKRWGFFKRFVEYLAEKKLLGLPGNLYSKPFKFKVEAAAVKKYDTAEVRNVLAVLTDRQRLYAMLGLNCGMTSADIGQLRKDMIEGGKLTRKRVKTDKWDKVPTVTYVLWPETLELLARCGSDHPTLVLTGKTGEALWSSRLESDGSTPQKDMISQQWKRAKVSIPHKAFRSIAATLLESHPTYGRYVEHFLGHSPKSVKDKHYAAPSDDVFAEAMAWLRTKLLVA